VPSGVPKVFSYGPLLTGNYTLKLKLDDGKGGIYTQSYVFTVLPLTITGAISHTADWESYREQWNLLYPAKSRLAGDFWAGEALELSSQVTDTGLSATKPLSVTAALLQTGDVTSLSSLNQLSFTGEMLKTSFVHTLADGSYTMRFQVVWSNGLIQTYDVSFRIKGNIYDVLLAQLRN